MEKRQYQVKVNDMIHTYDEGTTFEAIAKEFQSQYKNTIVLGCEKNRLFELKKTLKRDCELKFITTGDSVGNQTYKRSLCLMLVKAIHDICNHDKACKVRIDFSVDKGYYCTVSGGVVINEEFLAAVKRRMLEMVEAKMPIEKRSVHTDEAVALFKQHGMHDKERLFEYRRVSKVNIYSMNEFEDYYYGYMVPDASYLPYFELYLYGDGFVIQMPESKNPTVVPPFKPRQKLFQVLDESSKWGDMLGIQTVADLNEAVTQGRLQETILVQEALQEKKIGDIARTIVDRENVKFILIAGPSSSGKTTFSHRLSIQLRAHGIIPHPIAVDNYFVNREDTPRDEDGNYNYECLEAIDVRQFNKDMTDLLAGKEVELPSFNFKTGKREYNGKTKKLGEHDVLVIEGIHCLNDALTYQLPKDNHRSLVLAAL